MRRQPRERVADPLLSSGCVHPRLHRFLNFARRVERGKRRMPDSQGFALVRVARERRVHDYEVELAVADAADEVVDVLGGAAAGGDGGGAADQPGLGVRGEQVEGADADLAAGLGAVGHRQQALAAEGRGGVRAREHGGGEVDGDVEHVEADEAVLHHRRVEGLGVAAVQLVEQAETRVGCGEQRAGAAGEVADLQRGQRLGVAPVRASGRAVGGQREPGQQRGGGGPRVVGREELAVCDQALEDDAGEIVRARDAARHQRPRGVPERGEHGLRRGRGQRAVASGVEQRLRRGEDRPVVVGEDGVPLAEQRRAVEGVAVDEGLDGPRRAARARRPPRSRPRRARRGRSGRWRSRSSPSGASGPARRRPVRARPPAPCRARCRSGGAPRTPRRPARRRVRAARRVRRRGARARRRAGRASRGRGRSRAASRSRAGGRARRRPRLASRGRIRARRLCRWPRAARRRRAQRTQGGRRARWRSRSGGGCGRDGVRGARPPRPRRSRGWRVRPRSRRASPPPRARARRRVRRRRARRASRRARSSPGAARRAPRRGLR